MTEAVIRNLMMVWALYSSENDFNLIKLNNSIKKLEPKLEPDKNLNPFTIENGNSIKASKMPKQKRSVGLFGM
jgi:hypothetical protein